VDIGQFREQLASLQVYLTEIGPILIKSLQTCSAVRDELDEFINLQQQEIELISSISSMLIDGGLLDKILTLKEEKKKEIIQSLIEDVLG